MKNDNRHGGDNRDYRSGRPEDRRGDFRNKKPYGENRFDGPGRRTYGEHGNPPRVGRVADDVPRAQRVDNGGNRGAYRGFDGSKRTPQAFQDDAPHARRVSGSRDYHFTREAFMERGDRPHRSGELHRGGAYRSPTGPRRPPEYDYEPPEIPETLAAEFTDVPIDDEHLLVGRNPIREALKAGRPVEKLLVASGDLSGAAREIIRMAKAANVVVQEVDRARLDQIYPAHQGMLAYAAAVPYAALEDILAKAGEKGEAPFIVVLDGITDPHNLGAIIRSAECAGAHGVVIPERRAAGLSPAVAKAAAGALDHMPVARVKNINRALDELREAGVWITGTAMEGEDAFSADLTGPIALVIGAEGDGVSRLALQKCDRVVSLPMKGHIDSLNASVAAGILMYEVVRQRGQ